MKGRTLAFAATAVVAGVASSGAQAAKPKPAPPATSSSTTVVFYGQADRADETFGRPLASSLALFGAARRSATLPGMGGGMSLALVAAHMRERPGRLLLSATRRVATTIGAIYLVPTDRGWICAQGPSFATCHRGLLRAGVTWNFYTTSSGIDVVGIAGDDVSRVVLTSGAHRWTAWLHDNVFVVSRPLTIISASHQPALGTLAVSYRGRTSVAHVRLR